MSSGTFLSLFGGNHQCIWFSDSEELQVAFSRIRFFLNSSTGQPSKALKISDDIRYVEADNFFLEV